jgi:hypothetical protein
VQTATQGLAHPHPGPIGNDNTDSKDKDEIEVNMEGPLDAIGLGDRRVVETLYKELPKGDVVDLVSIGFTLEFICLQTL